MKHTQGEWKFYGNNDKGKNKYNEFLIVSDKYCIAKIPHLGSSNIFGTTEEEAEANAKLIAGSPLLLSALLGVLNNMDGNGNINLSAHGKVISEIKEAIKKATL